MSNDRYERIRSALAMRPTPGSREVFDLGMWDVEVRSSDTSGTICQVNNKGTLFHASEDGADRLGRSQARLLSDAFFIAACDPDTIRDLLAEHDALEVENERLREALVRILENEAPDWKFAEEFGGYVLDDELREEARAALAKAEAQK